MRECLHSNDAETGAHLEVWSREDGWFTILLDGVAVATVDSMEQALAVVRWWMDGCPS